MIWAFEINDAPPQFATQCFVAALKEGILLRPIGNTLYFMPPYSMTDAQAEFLLAGTMNALIHSW
jgi:adenosylmethionine-8-amino-7-oxononanoate aminotransferase